MFKILSKEFLCSAVAKFEIEAPLIARKARPGQFVIIRIDEKGERIPLTLNDWSQEKGTITLVALEAGATTKRLLSLREGDYLMDVVGPLGKPAEIRKYGKVACVGGGVGIACVYPEVRAFKEAGNYVISIIGARTRELLIFEEEIRKFSNELYVTTDDGSYGQKGLVSDALRELIEGGKELDLVLAVGPVPMMKAVADVTRPYGIKTVASLNPIMVDGTGMCGCCRVEVGGKTKFACVDGPEFDAHQVDFDLLAARNRRYLEEERRAMEGLGRRS
ncbi:MAG: sulfide/dihydroorotate dehydrogenase-like FAD/NAD-binding protein [Hadesarchaea archaeon]|nr:MAG: sulfide/dihydroorotate dehydrogenase-like FAD/NAD-binding protein [Hadesarchaea archaeon]TDA34486.1 MAG: sulfide/dihydroorotate dehydrogenase-like FAD/NAD-binding protein [Hadesarchaea archaeon]